MKDSTKHIIAKEIYFFFKWFVRGLGLGVIIGIIAIPLVRHFTGDTNCPWYMIMGLMMLGTAFYSLIGVYIVRLVRWLVQWVNKWR